MVRQPDPPFRCLTDDLHTYGTTVFIQLHHAATRTQDSISIDKVAPIAIPELSARAQKAGFDGVELHAAHGYLLSLFASPLYNHRTDEYGGSLENRVRLQAEIIQGVHQVCGRDFIIGSRIGGNEPTFEEGIAIAKLLEQAGADYLNISFGLDNHYNLSTPYWKPTPWPKDFLGNSVVYAASLIKRQVNIPIIAVRSICTSERGEWLLENGHADLIAYARPMLTNPDFVNNIKNNITPPTECLDCPCCQWFTDPRNCPIEHKHHRNLYAINPNQH